MSKIMKELVEATKQSYKKRSEDEQDFRERLCLAVGELDDAAWDALSTEAQDWFNDAAAAMNGKKDDLPDFPDMEPEVPDAPAARTRRGAVAAEPEPAAKPSRRGAAKQEELPIDTPQVGDIVVVTTKRDKVHEGELLEVDGETIYVDVDGTEMEFTRDRVKSIMKKDADASGEAIGEAAAAEDFKPQVDDEVTVTTKRGKATTGFVVEVDDKIIVLEVEGGGDQEFVRDRLESIVLAGEPEPKPEPAPAARTRRSAVAAEPEAAAPARGRGAAKDTKPAADTPRAGTKSNGGVSVTARMREMIVDDLKADKAAILKALKKEGLTFRENTLDLIYSDVHKLIGMLKDRKMLK